MVDNADSYSERVSRLVSWGHWFAFFNIIAALLIGTHYITQSPWPDTLLGQLYLTLSWIGHFGFLTFALYLLVLFPLTFVLPSQLAFRFLASGFATLGLTLLLIDTQTYAQFNLHLTPIVWEMLFNTQSKTLIELNSLFIALPVIFLLQLVLSEWVWRKARKLSHKRIGRPLALVFFVSFISSHLMFMWSDAYLYTPITSQKSNFPLSYPMTAKSFMEKHGLLDRDEYIKRLASTTDDNLELVQYPIEPLRFSRRANPLNVLVISINSLRAEQLNMNTMPQLTQFAERNLNFTQHYSSSNDTLGFFGLFYGLPSSYANSIQVQGTSPLLLDVLKQKNYQFGLFSENNFDDRLFINTVFRHYPLQKIDFTTEQNLDDQLITHWFDWVTQQNSPWFSFIELDGLDNIVSDMARFTPEKLHNNYLASASEIDIKVNQLLERLASLSLLEKTVIIITANHGTEFNETQTNSWGSNSNYSRYQLHVPLIIHWPGKISAQFTHLTSHLDVSVTLLEDLLGVSSNPSDYSSGRHLLDESSRKWILAGDKRELALITPKETTVIDKFGNFKRFDAHYQRITTGSPSMPVLMQGLTELQRFYSKDN